MSSVLDPAAERATSRTVMAGGVPVRAMMARTVAALPDELGIGSAPVAGTSGGGPPRSGTDLAVLNRCGHWPPFERPADYAGCVLSFLGR